MGDIYSVYVNGKLKYDGEESLTYATIMARSALAKCRKPFSTACVVNDRIAKVVAVVTDDANGMNVVEVE